MATAAAELLRARARRHPRAEHALEEEEEEEEEGGRWIRMSDKEAGGEKSGVSDDMNVRGER